MQNPRDGRKNGGDTGALHQKSHSGHTNRGERNCDISKNHGQQVGSTARRRNNGSNGLPNGSPRGRRRPTWNVTPVIRRGTLRESVQKFHPHDQFSAVAVDAGPSKAAAEERTKLTENGLYLQRNVA